MAEEGEAPEETPPLPPPSGTFIFPNGARYEGFYESKPVKEPEEGEDPETIEKVIRRQGVGVYKLNGNVYEGEWDQDKMHGHGTFKFVGGASYDGDWVENKFHGQGKYTWEHGAYYIGAWENNRMHGKGSFVDVDGREWKGEFYNGQGPGLHTLPMKKPSAEAEAAADAAGAEGGA